MTIIKMTDEQYFASDGLNASLLKQFAKSPAHAKHYLKNGIKSTSAMDLGTALHGIVLEGKTNWVEIPNINRRTKAGKEEFAAFNYISKHQLILNNEQIKILEGMRHSLLNNPIGKTLFNKHDETEKVLFANCPRTGLKLKCKVDWLPNDGNIMFDLKTTRDASYRKFKYTVRDFGYDIQAVHYLYCAELNELPHEQFCFVAVENAAPYGIGAFILSDEKLDEAKAYYHLMLEEYAKCLKDNDFSACYSEELQVID